MPKPTKGPRIGGSPSHQRIIMANLATQLFKHGKITTTLTRAKRMQPLAEHLITKAKRGDLHALRTVHKTVRDPEVLDHLFKQIGPSLKDRDGGYTRITKIGTRLGDAAPMAVIEILTEPAPAKAAPKKAAASQTKPAPVTVKLEADVAAAKAEIEDEASHPADDADEEATAEDVIEEEAGADDADEN